MLPFLHSLWQAISFRNFFESCAWPGHNRSEPTGERERGQLIVNWLGDQAWFRNLATCVAPMPSAASPSGLEEEAVHGNQPKQATSAAWEHIQSNAKMRSS
jgi:hypothetical protein